MPLTISRLTREYVFSDIETPDDMTGATGEATFKPLGELPIEADWVACDLIQITVVDPVTGESKLVWTIRVLVGDGTSLTLTPPDANSFDWQMWTRITDNPERPVRRPGIVVVE